MVGCNQGGYDTHGSENRRFNALSRDLGLALTALRLDLASIWQDMVILTMTEFGRTSRQNNNLGTDHGEAACNLLLGGSVRGGVYNCHDGGGLGSTWRTGDIYESRGRYVKHRTDYRQLYSEILEGHLGLADGVTMDEIIPGFSSLSGPDFRPLNLIS
ncbi:MAG: DUF1501 domain-containing protein [Planctomycetota bacterium]|nr:DUF1501 domain-containing protein [Planctomycetota bacterium]